METDVQNNDEITIDLGEIFSFILRKIGYVILATVLCAVLSFIITYWFITPQYTSTAKIYVLNRQSDESVTSSDITSSTYLTEDYIEMIQSRTVIESVIDDLNLDMKYDELLKVVTVSAQSDTRVIAISATDPDPKMAQKITDAICQASVVHIKQIMELESVNIVDEANLPDEPSSPSLTKNVLIAALLGLVASLAVLVVIFILDDKVKTSEDVERYLGISVLGAMPLDETLVREKKKRKARKNKKKRKG
ncbi:MAG: Wzz/FepE/Etk N-terminal domain-containing protein [Lachnospiraceae bacterium]|nr:Wzz/FepE/Etk N-terminal domain-containing protein [Lachnospiraceae bacterium]